LNHLLMVRQCWQGSELASTLMLGRLVRKLFIGLTRLYYLKRVNTKDSKSYTYNFSSSILH